MDTDEKALVEQVEQVFDQLLGGRERNLMASVSLYHVSKPCDLLVAPGKFE